jgi:hypothetical protein
MLTVRSLDGEDAPRSRKLFAAVFGGSIVLALIAAILVAWGIHSTRAGTRKVPKQVPAASQAVEAPQEIVVVDE